MYHWLNFSQHWGMPLGMGLLFGVGAALFFLVILWSVIWKGMALWKAARKGDKIWFVVLLVVNSLGILDILYIYFFSEKSAKK